MKKNAVNWKNLLLGSKLFRVLSATLLLTLGVYFSFPERGLLATFPLCFLFSFGAFWLYSSLAFLSTGAFLIAFFYGMLSSFPAYPQFGVVAFLCALAGGLCAKGLRSLRGGKKLLFSLLFFFSLFMGMLLPLLYMGTPTAYLAAKDRATEFLKEKYPDQHFSQMVFYRENTKVGYLATVYYEYQGNWLSSQLFFGEEGVEDGFLTDYSLWMMEKYKSELIGILQNGSQAIMAESIGLLQNDQVQSYPGSYGVFQEAWIPWMHFSVGYRQEKPDRRDFALAVKESFDLLRQAEFDYGQITFYALDAGNVVYECCVTPETCPEEILALVRYAR